MSIAKGSYPSLADSDGFTLIELLVTMLCGIVVIMALFTIVDVTLDQATRTFSKIDAVTRARVKLEQVENQLHSACMTAGVQPILSGSSATELIFLSAYGNGASLTPNEYEITYNSSTNTLTEQRFAETSESPGAHPTYTFSSTASNTTTLLTNVSQSGSTPMFQYFPYGEVSNGSGGYYEDPDGNAYEVLLDGQNTVPNQTPAVTAPASPLVTSSAPTLTSTTAPTAAEVVITLKVGPTVGETGIESNTSTYSQGADAPLTVQDSVVLRLTDPANHVGAGANFGPCD